MLQSRSSKLLCFLLSIVFLSFGVICNILYGFHTYSLATLIEALFHFDGSKAHITIMTINIPRALIAVSVGGSLAVAGAIMQAFTRNPLASPSIFGINAGAVLFITIALSFIDSALPLLTLVWVGFFGAALTALLVYIVGLLGRGETNLRIVLAGAAITAFCSSLTSIISLIKNENIDTVLFWLVGSIAGRDMEHLLSVLPYMMIAIIAAFLISGSVNVLSMGEDVAKSLGQRTALIKGLIAVIVVLLAGASVSITGPIGFVGLVVPHISRFIAGLDYRWVIPYCAILGGNLLVYADLVSKLLLPSANLPIGVATAIMGVPFFVYLARKRIS